MRTLLISLFTLSFLLVGCEQKPKEATPADNKASETMPATSTTGKAADAAAPVTSSTGKTDNAVKPMEKKPMAADKKKEEKDDPIAK